MAEAKFRDPVHNFIQFDSEEVKLINLDVLQRLRGIRQLATRLKALGFVSETSLHTGAINEDGFEIARHDFDLTEEGRTIAEHKAKHNPDAARKIKQAIAKFKKGGELDYMRMSVAAKTFFMLSKEGKPATAIELSESAKKLGWDPKPIEIAESIEFLKNIGLVSTKPV